MNGEIEAATGLENHTMRLVVINLKVKISSVIDYETLFSSLCYEDSFQTLRRYLVLVFVLPL